MSASVTLAHLGGMEAAMARWSGWQQARRIVAVLVLIGAATVGCLPAAVAQNYPSKPVRIVVPFPAGGPLDFTARLLADALAARLKQPFIVENRPGASGNLGTETVARAAADGYSLLFALDTPFTVNPALFDKLGFDPFQDFAPISAVASFSLTLVTHPSVPVRSVAEFVTHAKALRDRPLLYGSGGAGGDPGHLTMEYFRSQAGFAGQYVPFKGNAEVVMGLVGGHIQAGFLATPGVLPSVREGRLKALGVSSPARSELAPEIPTIAESGYADFDVRFYQVMLAPAGTPDAIRSILEREVRDAMQSADQRSRLRSQALEPMTATGTEAEALLRAAAERWRRVVQSAGIQRK
jgi:tripartite-type tricarboxylate transporter receptor subunit TctC